MDSIIIFLDRIYRIDGIFFACGERPFGRRPLYPDDPVNPVHLLFIDKNPFLFFAVLRCSILVRLIYETTPKCHGFLMIKLAAFLAGGGADT